MAFPETFVVAEVGLNFSNFQEAKQAVADAAACGADAVKFQFFSQADLYGAGEDEETKFKIEWLADLKNKADLAGIKLACSVFDPKSVRLIDPFVAFHKIAASEARWPQLIKACLKTKKPLMINVVGLGNNEIRKIVEWARPEISLKDLVLMYGEPSYPSRYHYMALVGMLRDKYPECTIGFSDHSIDVIDAPLTAQAQGAQVIEKHVQFVAGDFPDTKHSLDGTDFKIMIECLKGQRPVVGLGRHDYAAKWARRLVATAEIQPREAMRYGKNYSALRWKGEKGDWKGINPMMAEDFVEGQPAKQKIVAGDPISGDNVVIKQPGRQPT